MDRGKAVLVFQYIVSSSHSKRALYISSHKVEYDNLDKEKCRDKFEDEIAILFQHEYDHLNQVMVYFIPRLSFVPMQMNYFPGYFESQFLLFNSFCNIIVILLRMRPRYCLYCSLVDSFFQSCSMWS